MFDIISKILLFCSAYCPLFLIILIKNGNEFGKNFPQLTSTLANYKNFNMDSALNILTVINLTILVAAFTLGIIFLLIVLIKSKTTKATQKLKIIEYKNITSENMTYIVTYLIPFLSINMNSSVDLFCILIIVLTVGVIYIHSDMLYVNPMLNLFGYRIYQVKGEWLNISKTVEKPFIVYRKLSPLKKESVIEFVAYDNTMLIATNESNDKKKALEK